MTIRTASLLAAAALAGLATPVLSQDGRYDPGPPPPLPEQGAWEEEWIEEAYEDGGQVERDVRLYRHAAPPAQGTYYAPQPRYTAEQREAWFEECLATRQIGVRRNRGTAIGGTVGAVAGGVVGHEIAGEDDETVGTLVGAGVGALAGAAIRRAVGADADRDSALAECGGYWAQYEQGQGVAGTGYGHGGHAPAPYGHGAYPAPGYGYAYPYPYPVVWVRVPIVTERRGCGCERVIEEWVEETPAPPPPRPRRTKMVRIRSVK